MTYTSSKLALPYIAPAQSQKHVTVNEALQALDSLVQLSALARRASPPDSPKECDTYIIETAVEGPEAQLWAERNGQIAVYSDNGWQYHASQEGWLCWVAEDEQLFVQTNQTWQPIRQSLTTLSHIGINAAADKDNKFIVKSKNSLLDHDGADHRLKINKRAVSDTASVLFQAAYVGYAEFGLLGDNNFRLKISSDGNIWTDAVVVSANTGALNVAVPIQRAGHDVYDAGHAPGVLNLKGDIGAGEDLNTYVSTGLWHQPLNTNARSGLNYPEGQAGLLTVVSSGAMTYQTYRVFAGGGAMADLTYTRGRYATNWSAWRAL